MRQNVPQNTPWNLEGLKPETREAAKEAAKRSGMGLDDWLSATVSDRITRTIKQVTAPVKKTAAEPASLDLDNITARLNKLEASRTQQFRQENDQFDNKKKSSDETSSQEDHLSSGNALIGKDVHTLIALANSENERKVREQSSKTAQALDSVARWMEGSEERMAEHRRLSSERQERTTAVLGEALSLMTRRLDDIENKVVNGQQPSVNSAMKAVERLEAYVIKLGEAKIEDREQTRHERAQIEKALKGFENRIEQIAEKVSDSKQDFKGDEKNLSGSRRSNAPIQDIRQALIDVRKRQTELDHQEREHVQVNLHQAVIPPVQEVRKDIEKLAGTVSELATQNDVKAIEGWIRELASYVAKAQSGGKDTKAIASSVSELQQEVSRLVDGLESGQHNRLKTDIEHLAYKVDQVAASGLNPAIVDDFSKQLVQISHLFGNIAEPQKIQELANQVSELSEHLIKIDSRQIDHRDFVSLKSSVEDIRGLLNTSSEKGISASRDLGGHFDQIARKLDHLSDQTPRAAFETILSQLETFSRKLDDHDRKTPADLNAVVQHFENMAKTLEDRSGRLSQDLLNRFETLSIRLERQSDLAQKAAGQNSNLDLNRQAGQDLVKEVNQSIGDSIERLGARLEGALKTQDRFLEDQASDLEGISQRLDRFGTELRPVKIEPVIDRLDRLDETMRALRVSLDLKPVETMIDKLSSRIDQQTGLLQKNLADELDRGLTKKLDQSALFQKLEGVTSHLETAFRKQSNEIGTVTERLEEGLKNIRSSFDLRPVESLLRSVAATSRPVDLTGVTQRLDRLEDTLRHAQSSVNLKPLEDMIRLQPTQRLEDYSKLAQKLDRLDETIRTTKGSVNLKPLEELLSSLASQSLAKGQSVAGTIAFDSVLKRLDRLDETLKFQKSTSDLKPIEAMLASLASKLDNAAHFKSTSSELNAIEKQVSDISKKLDRDLRPDPAMSGLERTMNSLMAQMEKMRETTFEGAERAAKTAIADTLGSLPKTLVQSSPDVHALKRDLADFKAHHQASDKRNYNTLHQVHTTLEQVVTRLASLEGGLKQKSRKAEVRPSVEQNPVQTVQSVQVPVVADLPVHSFAQASTQAHEQIVQNLKNEMAQENVSSFEKLTSEPSHLPFSFLQAPQKSADLTALKEEELLEPGTQRPAIPVQDAYNVPAGNTPSDIKASFIAAARRAAQNAANEAASAANRSKVQGAQHLNRAFTAKGQQKRNQILAQARQTFDEKRKPIIMGAAAIVLAIGAAQVFNGLYRSSDMQIADMQVVETTRTPVQAPAAETIKAPQMMVAKIEPAEKPAASEWLDPTSTAAIPGSNAFQKNTPPSLEARFEKSPVLEKSTPDIKRPSIPNIGELPSNIQPLALRQAAMNGDALAVYEVALRVSEGRNGATRDPKLAARLFERVAAHGLAPAQYRIGNFYEKGIGVNRDLNLAKLWYERAAQGGNARAMHNLAVLVAEGSGGKPDYTTAISLFRKAAEYGIKDSQFNLGVLSARGLGLSQDLGQSYLWFSLAAAQGDTDAARKRDEVASRLTPIELASAKVAVENWRVKPLERGANEVEQPDLSSAEMPQKKPGNNRG